MGRGQLRRLRGDPGGIAWLARELDAHAGAIDYDLMTRTSYTIHDLGGRLRWSTLAHFLRYLPIDSAYVRETHPEMAEQIAWMDGKVTAKVLADLIDEVRGLEHMYARAHTKHGVRVPAPQPYETPWTSDQSAGRRRYGKDPIPIADFDAWWDAQGSSRHTDAS